MKCSNLYRDSNHGHCLPKTIFIGIKGRTKRGARDVRDAVEGEKLRWSGEKLDRIRGDLETLTRENETLIQEVKNSRSREVKSIV